MIDPPRRLRAQSVRTRSQEGWVATRLDFLVNWSRANSLWPMPFGTACCAIEFMATAASRFDLARFGMERMSFSPRQADVLICAGRVPFKLAPIIRRIWQQMPQPKWAISMGACASSGGGSTNTQGARDRHDHSVDSMCPGPARPRIIPGSCCRKKRGTSAVDKRLARDDPDPRVSYHPRPSSTTW